jgi:uncharacterized protein (TIGR02996 family)
MDTFASALCCPSCGAELSRPVQRVPDERLLDLSQGTRVAPGTWAPLRPSHPYEPLPLPLVSIHPDDLLARQVIASGSGCCGYVVREGKPNLRCRCGEAVGFVQDDHCPPEVSLPARWSDRRQALAADPGLSRRLERALIEVGPAQPSQQVEEAWWGADPRDYGQGTPADPFFALRPDGEGLRAELRWGAQSRWLPLTRMALVRALATRRLPMGDLELGVAYQLVDPATYRTVEGWALMRDGERAWILQAEEPTLALLTRADWLQLAWQEAVDTWAAGWEEGAEPATASGEDLFLDGLARAPGDEALRQVYADWLEERGMLSKARFLRGQGAGSLPALAPDWLAQVDRTEIAGCPLPSCPGRWEALPAGPRPRARTCPSCSDEVAHCASLWSAHPRLQQGQRTAVASPLRGLLEG